MICAMTIKPRGRSWLLQQRLLTKVIYNVRNKHAAKKFIVIITIAIIIIIIITNLIPHLLRLDTLAIFSHNLLGHLYRSCVCFITICQDAHLWHDVPFEYKSSRVDVAIRKTDERSVPIYMATMRRHSLKAFGHFPEAILVHSVLYLYLGITLVTYNAIPNYSLVVCLYSSKEKVRSA